MNFLVYNAAQFVVSLDRHAHIFMTITHMYTIHDSVLTVTSLLHQQASLSISLSHSWIFILFDDPLRLTWAVYAAMSNLLELGWLSNRYTTKLVVPSPTPSPRYYQ